MKVIICTTLTMLTDAAQNHIRAREEITPISVEAPADEIIRAVGPEHTSSDSSGVSDMAHAPYGLEACRCDRYFVQCVEEEMHEDEFVHICLYIDHPNVRMKRISSFQLKQHSEVSGDLTFKIMTKGVPHNQFIDIKNYGRKMLIATQETAASLFDASTGLSNVKVTGDVVLNVNHNSQIDAGFDPDWLDGEKSVQFNLPLQLSVGAEKLTYEEEDEHGEWKFPMSVAYWLISVLIILILFVCTAHICICRWYQKQHNTQMLKVVPVGLGAAQGAAPARQIPGDFPPPV